MNESQIGTQREREMGLVRREEGKYLHEYIKAKFTF